MSRLLLFNKPYGVLSQFTTDGDHPTLAQFISVPGIYPAGRLDRDSEGLLLLTDDGALQHRIANPKHKTIKTYWAQVDGDMTDTALEQLRRGLVLKDGKTQPAHAQKLNEPSLWTRNPPIRFRANIPTSWIEISIREGRNRQVRRMTAAVGFPTLRLVRVAIGEWSLGEMQPGESNLVEVGKVPPHRQANKHKGA